MKQTRSQVGVEARRCLCQCQYWTRPQEVNVTHCEEYLCIEGAIVSAGWMVRCLDTYQMQVLTKLQIGRPMCPFLFHLRVRIRDERCQADKMYTPCLIGYHLWLDSYRPLRHTDNGLQGDLLHAGGFKMIGIYLQR
jgi:hypothetical protein